MGRPLEEHELVERARAGDAGAYAVLVRGHQEIAFRTAYLICGNAADAEDAAQEGFVKAHRALGRFRAGEPLRPWLLTIVANEARNRRRSANRREALALRAPQATAGEAGFEPSPEAAIHAPAANTTNGRSGSCATRKRASPVVRSSSRTRSESR